MLEHMAEPVEQSSAWCRELYQAHGAELLLYGRALGLSVAESEDTLQDTFVALLALAEPPGQPKHYALRAFRNRCLNHRRSLFRRIAREIESRCWFEPQDPHTNREEAATECLSHLPTDQREVIVLKIWHQLTFDEIGSMLEISPNTAAGRYRYGMAKLRDRLSQTDYEPARTDGIGRAIEVLETA